MTLAATGAAALAAINGWTLIEFWRDKRRAERKLRRIPEARLLGLTLCGGTPAAFAARRLLRHKTRKQPFTTRLWLIAAAQLAALAWFAST